MRSRVDRLNAVAMTFSTLGVNTPAPGVPPLFVAVLEARIERSISRQQAIGRCSDRSLGEPSRLRRADPARVYGVEIGFGRLHLRRPGGSGQPDEARGRAVSGGVLGFQVVRNTAAAIRVSPVE